jgi:pimeloyl-ACP methyl ester carboxylesterase
VTVSSVAGVTGSVSVAQIGEPELVLVHANGFCKEVWRPVLEDLESHGYVSIDQPGHGGSDAPDPPFDWWDFGRNALAVIEEVGADRPVGIGHSSGAAALAMAEILRPGTFERLVLVEPIVDPGPYVREEGHHLANGAMRRRATFDSYEHALGSYRDRGPFRGWDDRALEAYVTHGFHLTDEGWTLRCLPEVEAEVYRTSTVHGAWDRLGEIECPVDLVAGARSDTHFEEFASAQMARFANATLHMIREAGHFVPMTHPDRVASVVG